MFGLRNITMLGTWFKNATLGTTLQLTSQHYNPSPRAWDQKSYKLEINIFYSHW